MRKILGFSLLLLALALMAGCSDDKKSVSLEISPLNADIQTGETVFLKVTAKNTSIIMPDPLDLPGSYRLVGTTGIQYTAPEDPPKAGDFAAVTENDKVRITVCAAAEKSNCKTATLNVLYKVPEGNVEPGNIIIFRNLSERAQFTATFKDVKIYGNEATGYSTPKYRIIPDRHVRCENDGPNGAERCILREDILGYFPGADANGYSYSGAFYHYEYVGLNSQDIGTIEASLELDPRVYGLDITGNKRYAKATARVRVRPPSDRFKWVTLLTGVGYGATGTQEPVLSRPFFTDDKLTRSEDGQYIVYHSCQENTTTCSERLVRKDKGVKEPELLTSRLGNLVDYPGNVEFPIKIREQPQAASLKTPYTEAARKYIPLGALNGIPSQHETAAGYGASHPSLTSMIREDNVVENGEVVRYGNTIGVFEMSLNNWPPIARIFVARWPNNISDDEPMWWGYDCTWTQITGENHTCAADDEPEALKNSRQFEYQNVLSTYSIVAFAKAGNNYGPGMLSKVARQGTPKPPAEFVFPDIDVNDRTIDRCSPVPEVGRPRCERALAAYDLRVDAYAGGEGANWALGYFDGNRMTVRGLVFQEVNGKLRMRLRGSAVSWDPTDKYTLDHSRRNYLTDLVFDNIDEDFIAVGVVGQLDPNEQYYGVTAWRYMSGLAIVKSEDQRWTSKMRSFYGCTALDEEGEFVYQGFDPESPAACVEEETADAQYDRDKGNWDADIGYPEGNAAAYDAWDKDNDPNKPLEPPAGVIPPPEVPVEPERFPTTYELLEEMLGCERFRIMYTLRDPGDDCLIIIGYGTDSETGQMVGFMAKSYDRGFKSII